MSRPIKFRAWDAKAKHMFMTGYLSKIAERAGGQISTQWPIQSLLHDETIIFMQYTGHQSIDGQEIYEDDLLIFPNDNHVYRVKWLDDEGCWGVMYSETVQMGKIGIVQFMKVVGNIYESSDLITTEKGR